MLSLQFAPNAPWNDSAWNNERMGELLIKSRGEKDPIKRKQMYCEMQSLVRNESGIIIPVHTNFIDGVNDKVKGIPWVPLSNMGGSEWPEFAWFA
jgi:peptide/nickel transport system substrate-binding protein